MGELVLQVCRAAQSDQRLKKKGDNREPKALSSMRDAKANGDAYHDRSCEREQNRSATSIMGNNAWKNPTVALEEALRRSKEKNRASSLFCGKRR